MGNKHLVWVSVTPAYPALTLKRQAPGEPRVREGQIVVVFSGQEWTEPWRDKVYAV